MSFSWFLESFPVIDQKPLLGAFEAPDSVALSTSNWLDESYQKSVQKNKQFNHPLRSFFVRLRNQLDYSIFNKANFYDVLIGKEGYIFSEAWGKTASGKLNKNEAFYKDSLAPFKVLQDYKKRHGGTFLMMIAPSKERLHSEFLPNGYQLSPVSDYNLLIKSLANNKINHIDFVERFKAIQDTSQYLLYGKTSTHWTTYGAYIAMKEMLDSIESQCEIDMLNWRVSSISKEWPTKDDKDIEETMNLLFSLNQKQFAYPGYEFDAENDSIKKPKVIIISDSFYWGINNSFVPYHLFSKSSSFWYYFKSNFENIQGPSTLMNEVDVLNEIKSADAVLMMVGSENMEEFPYGFEQFLVKNLDEFLK